MGRPAPIFEIEIARGLAVNADLVEDRTMRMRSVIFASEALMRVVKRAAR